MNELLLNAYRFHRAYNKIGASINGRKVSRLTCHHAWHALNLARADVAAGKARYPRGSYGAVCWQPGKPGIAWVQNVDGAGLRHIGNVEAESHGGRIWSNRDSCGWYSDNDQNETIYGVVYQLPGRDGKARFVAGYASADDCDGLPTLDFGSIYESDESSGANYSDDVASYDGARDAARTADSMAQHAAESEREYQSAWQAGSRFAELAETVTESRKSALVLLAERRRAATAGKGASYLAICGAIRDKVESLLESISEARQERAKLKEGKHVNDWLPGFWSGDKRLQAAFNEGAGQSVFSV